jgi:hypothetical protein
VWRPASEDPSRPCKFCGLAGRQSRPASDVRVEKTENHLSTATAERSEIFSRLAAPMQSGTGDPAKAWPKGLTPEQQARADAVVADKKRRDAVARESGVGRPGQLRGKK